MQIVYVMQPNIYLAIDDGTVFCVQKNTSRIINPHAIKVKTMEASPFQKFGVDGNVLHLDGLGLIEVAGWLYSQDRTVRRPTFLRRLCKLFGSGQSPFYSDTVRAVGRAVSPHPSTAQGEDAYFVSEQWRQHPAEFAELAAALR